jgi:RNA polymerase sigma-70 factor (ECF subfamily)
MKVEELYDLYGEKLFHYLTIKLGSINDAEDVLQQIFLRFARYSIRWKFIRNVEAFVFRVARNEANRFTRQKINQEIDPQTIIDLTATIGEAIVGPDQNAKDILARALGSLPEEQREVIVLKIFEGLTFKEIASVCGLSINTVASRYRYALANLKSFMEGKDEGTRKKS